MDKTNAMRILDGLKAVYEVIEYDESVTDGVSVAALTGQPADGVFKTLVTQSAKGENIVFVIPVNKSLDMKKAAAAAGVKRVEMLDRNKLKDITGYVHGGCSPVGMKKRLRTFIDESARGRTVTLSGGKRGVQIKTDVNNIVSAVCATFAELTS